MNPLLLAVICYLGLGFLVSFFVKTEDRIDSGWPKAVLFFCILLYYIITVVSWPKELIDEYL